MCTPASYCEVSKAPNHARLRITHEGGILWAEPLCNPALKYHRKTLSLSSLWTTCVYRIFLWKAMIWWEWGMSHRFCWLSIWTFPSFLGLSFEKSIGRSRCKSFWEGGGFLIEICCESWQWYRDAIPCRATPAAVSTHGNGQKWSKFFWFPSNE